MSKPIKYNLGCGDKELSGYMNIDLKLGRTAYPLDVPPGTADEIRASHLLEHFPHNQVVDVLKNWARALKPGGVMKIAVPDFRDICRRYIAGQDINVTGYVMGGQVDRNDFHKTIFDDRTLRAAMSAAGLTQIRSWASTSGDCASLPISLNLCGNKPAEPCLTNTEHVSSQLDKNQTTKIEAVLSMPRLAFTENMFAAMRIVKDLGIHVTRGSGVFWGQVLSRMIGNHLTDGTEYILTIDYDTWFTTNHVIRLTQLLAENPDADAIIPIQAGREMKTALLGMRNDDGSVKTHASFAEFDGPLTPIATGHFGLTMFRASSFGKLKKPWFVARPGPDGDWDENRVDEDIHFWLNARDCGWNVYQANEIYIGHLQQVCTVCDPIRSGLAPRHYYLSDLEKGKIPDHMKIKIEFKQ